MAAGRSFEFNQAERGRCRPVRWRMGAEMGEEADCSGSMPLDGSKRR
ncbi:hypothetical protein DP42_3898 [Burkholderia pseudomallei]|nr:hypothetical protein DP42_3898 [Burkholderia pseudomallei]